MNLPIEVGRICRVSGTNPVPIHSVPLRRAFLSCSTPQSRRSLAFKANSGRQLTGVSNNWSSRMDASPPVPSQEIVKKYTSSSARGNKYAALASVLGSLTWPTPLFSDYQRLARESEYAAWTLVNGYALNHLTVSVHCLKSDVRKIGKLNQLVEDNNFKLNTEGGVLKVSPDGRLQQSSTVADSMQFQFGEGITASVPASYIEFAERLVLPEYESLPDDKIMEWHRRDGFEVGNADKIFESTSSDQLSRNVA